MLTARVLLGDCKEHLKSLDSDSFDSLVTDPPAGISFMEKAWDSYESLQHFQDDMTEVFRETVRVLKPGAHGLVWALPRTSNYTANALAAAGFELRDSVLHLFGSGMPKGLNVAKSGAGEAWEGWGTTLKPAHEIWWLVRKPLAEKTVVKQVLATGTGALNIDAARVATSETLAREKTRRFNNHSLLGAESRVEGEPWTPNSAGRWPANTVLSHAESCVEDGECQEGCAVKVLDEHSGIRPSGGKKGFGGTKVGYGFNGTGASFNTESSSGGASRYFYTAKILPNERKLSDGSLNQHPTAKSVKLMRYFVRLVTPPKGTLIDPFAGSGTTGVAALREGFNFLGIELDPEHHRVATLRVEHELVEQAQSDLLWGDHE